MRTVELGEAFENILSVVGEHVDSCSVFDLETKSLYDMRSATEIFDWHTTVYLTDQWHQENKGTHVWVLNRLSRDPMIVGIYMPENGPVESAQALKAIVGGHEFDVIDMGWTCQCGEELEPDAHDCPECGCLNPFLGVLI